MLNHGVAEFGVVLAEIDDMTRRGNPDREVDHLVEEDPTRLFPRGLRGKA